MAAALAMAGSAAAQDIDSKGQAAANEAFALLQGAGAAFECSEYANTMDEPKERERLFKYGLYAGRRAFPAIAAYEKRYEGKDPGNPLLLRQMPDFQAGMIYGLAVQEARKHIEKPETPRGQDPLPAWKHRANARYEQLNCRLIGREAP